IQFVPLGRVAACPLVAVARQHAAHSRPCCAERRPTNKTGSNNNMSASVATPTPTLSTDGPQAFGHPRGLMTLFFTELWERFTYYGMRALLVLFLADNVSGGFGFTDQVANAIYGLYICATYILCVPGGWIADRLIGARRAVWYGGILIVIGNSMLALGATPAS